MGLSTMKTRSLDGYNIQTGDLVEIYDEFVPIAGCNFALVIKSYKLIPPPSTTMKRSMADILKPNGTIGIIPISFVKNVYRGQQ